MKRYKITLLVPHERYVQAEDMKAAHKEANRLAHINNTDERAPRAILHSVIEQNKDNVADFGPSPAA